MDYPDKIRLEIHLHQRQMKLLYPINSSSISRIEYNKPYPMFRSFKPDFVGSVITREREREHASYGALSELID
jgi:hypothetical protein